MGWTGTHFYKNIKTVADKKEAKVFTIKVLMMAIASVWKMCK